MLRLANDAGASAGERDNAMRMAHATLAKHNLDLTSVESAPSNESPEEPRIESVGAFGGWLWARDTSISIAELFFCSYIYSRAESAPRVRHYFIGRTSNATTACLVAEFVVTAVSREASKLARARYVGGSGFVRSFGWGAAIRIRERVQQLKTDESQLVKPTSAGMRPTVNVVRQTIVLASVYESEQKANADFIATRYPNLGAARSGKRTVHAGAYGAGQVYGNTISLSRQLK
jgi:hypothetical protein